MLIEITIKNFTPREQMVMDLYTQGQMYKQIAFALGLSESAVKVIVRIARSKLGMATAVRRARVEVTTRWQQVKAEAVGRKDLINA